MPDPGALLDALAEEGPWRRARQTTWDIGTRTTDEALSRVRQAGTRLPQYAVGELAGTALVERLVEPAVVVVWIPKPDLARWKDELLGQPAAPAPGRIVARVAPDPEVVWWGEEVEGLRIADPVQLYIDCRHAGERAIDAADAMRVRVLSR